MPSTFMLLRVCLRFPHHRRVSLPLKRPPNFLIAPASRNGMDAPEGRSERIIQRDRNIRERYKLELGYFVALRRLTSEACGDIAHGAFAIMRE